MRYEAGRRIGHGVKGRCVFCGVYIGGSYEHGWLSERDKHVTDGVCFSCAQKLSDACRAERQKRFMSQRKAEGAGP